MSKHVMAKDLSNVGIKGTVHLWHCVDNVFKSLTNDPKLLLLEEIHGFDLQKFVFLIAENNGYFGGKPFKFPDGFAFIDHSTQTGNYIVSDGWNEKVETELSNRGYLVRH